MDNLLSVQGLFENRMFRIPDYQRGYAWETENWRDFIDDLEFLADNKDHFTGLVVLHELPSDQKKTDEKRHVYSVFDVIDGQQRLATMVLLIDAIRREMDKFEETKIGATGLDEQYISVKDRNGQPMPKLDLGSDNQTFFFKSVLERGLEVEGPTIASHQRLLGAKEYFATYLKAKREELGSGFIPWLDNFSDKVTGRLKMMMYAVSNDAEAGVIFETMNNRGKLITELEKVKNYLLYLSSKLDLASDNNLAQSINETWSRIFRNLMRAGLVSQEDEDRLLRVHWLMAYRYQVKDWHDSRSVKSRFNLRDYQGRHIELLHDLQEYIDTLGNAATAFCDIYNPTSPEAFGMCALDASLRNQVSYASNKLVRLGTVAPFLPFLISIRLRYPENGNAYLNTVELCEMYAFRVYSWRGSRANAGLTRLYRLGYRLFHNQRTLENSIDKMKEIVFDYCSDKQFAERFQLDVDWYDWSGIKYFLYEYEGHLAREARIPIRIQWETVSKRDKKDTVEHILPQTPDKIVYWTDRFSPTAREKHTHDIGNLCLTFENSSLSNKSFPDKKGIPGEKIGYVNSIVFMEKQLAKYENWTEKELLERRQEIQAWAMTRWHVAPLAASEAALEDESEDAIIRDVLTRIDIPKGQRALFEALYEAGEQGLSISQLGKAMGRTRSQLIGVLGALGNRINQTGGVSKSDPPGIGLFLEIRTQDEETHYWLRQALREILDEEGMEILSSPD